MLYEVLSAAAESGMKPTEYYLDGTIDDKNVADFEQFLIDSGFIKKEEGVFTLIRIDGPSKGGSPVPITEYYYIQEAKGLLGSIRPGEFDKVYDHDWDLGNYHMVKPGVWKED